MHYRTVTLSIGEAYGIENALYIALRAADSGESGFDRAVTLRALTTFRRQWATAEPQYDDE